MRVVLSICLLVWALALLEGCGDGKPPMADVTGKVTLDDQPIEGATVHFHFVDNTGARPGVGLTNAEGEFQMTTWKGNDGGLVGKHKVTLSKIMNPMSPNEHQLFPEKYANIERTELEAEVTERGDNRFEFDVTSK